MRNKKLMKKVLCAALTAAMAVGCTVPVLAEEGEKVTVTLGIWPEDTLEDQIEMHEGFVERMKEIDPNVEFVPAYYKYATETFMPMVEAGNCPTIFESWFTETKKLIREGAVADITDELEARGWLDKMNPVIREQFSDENGRVYGIPRDAYALGLMCNVEVFEEAGLVNDDGTIQYPKTWDELAETAKTIKDKTGSAGLCLLAKDNAGGWHWSNIAWAFGATLVDENEDGTYTAHLDSEEAIAAMDYVKSLKWDYDVLTADPTSEDWGTGFTQLGTGGAAMYIGANDAINQPTEVNGLPVDKVALVPIPAGPGGQYLLQGGTPYMFSKDATPEEINAALDYLEVFGKAPSASEDAVAGWEADYSQKESVGCPVIPRFPCWTDQEIMDAEQAVIDAHSNVDMKLFQDYFDLVDTDALRTEEPGLTQDMYAEITKVLQEVMVNEDADTAALMATANENYQQILDDKFKAN
ncbi:MAG: extracellular solute-binding protein [Eubacteriales bacterium]|nr:extracellular solute-binding protein [Eubacteriales bacterium]